MRLCGISSCFQLLSPCIRQVAHALLTRPPLEYGSFRNVNISSDALSPFDLHVLSTPPAFILSQDQTLNNLFPLLLDFLTGLSFASLSMLFTVLGFDSAPLSSLDYSQFPYLNQFPLRRFLLLFLLFTLNFLQRFFLLAMREFTYNNHDNLLSPLSLFDNLCASLKNVSL